MATRMLSRPRCIPCEAGLHDEAGVRIASRPRAVSAKSDLSWHS
jgi:hypothetical protein